MKVSISGINKIFESRVRLGIMSALMINESLDFNGLKDTLGVTDGNLASHLKALEDKELIRVNKKFIGRKPNTSYSVTQAGNRLFRAHLKALEDIINSQ